MGLRKAMEDDPKVLIMGEDVGKLGGVFRITDGLQKDFGEDRVIDTPAGRVRHRRHRGRHGACAATARSSRSSSTASSTRPTTRSSARSPRCTTASKGKLKMPMVIRIPFGGGIGAVEHHSESPEAQFAHTPGLKVVACSNPVDGYWMIQQAIACDDPVIFLEPKRQYHADKAELDDDARPPSRCSPRGSSGQGTDVTLLAYGPMVKTALEAAEAAAERGPVARGHRPAHALAARHGARCSSPYAAPAARSSSTRRTSTSAWAPSSPPGSPRSASTPSRRRCCASAASTRPTRRRGSRRSTCPTSTGCSTPSTASLDF